MRISSHPLRQNRNAVNIDAVITRACGATQSVPVEDLSIDGCAVRGWFRVGEKLALKLPRIGQFSARVRWASGGRAGLRFERGAKP